MTNEPVVEWNWWLCKSSNMARITELTGAHNKQLNVILNQPGKASCRLHLLDEDCQYVQEIKTALLLYRNGVPVWSGPVMHCNEESKIGAHFLTIEAVGWFEYLNRRIMHVGEEWTKMVKEYEELTGFGYSPVGTESAVALYYPATPEVGSSATPNTFTTIISDHVTRANVEYPTGITMGLQPATNPLNYTVPRFHPIGESIFQLSGIESGPDYEIHPETKKFNLYWNRVRGSVIGKGADKPNVRFTYPGNCVGANRSGDGTRMLNREYAVGQYGVGVGQDLGSIHEFEALFEKSENLTDVTHREILVAFAEAQVAVLKQPLRVITMEPKPYALEDTVSAALPRPFEDYGLGDIVYVSINKGNRFIVGIPNPQPVRLFGMTINISDDGVEKVSQIQTTYTQ